MKFSLIKEIHILTQKPPCVESPFSCSQSLSSDLGDLRVEPPSLSLTSCVVTLSPLRAPGSPSSRPGDNQACPERRCPGEGSQRLSGTRCGSERRGSVLPFLFTSGHVFRPRHYTRRTMPLGAIVGKNQSLLWVPRVVDSEGLCSRSCGHAPQGGCSARASPRGPAT